MNSRSPEEQKKAVCTSLVGAIRESCLADQIDVRRFYSMVSDKFDRLCRNGVLDLEPIWAALAGRYAHEDLYGLFLRFAQVTENLGIQARQATIVNQLPENSKSAYLSDFGQYVSASRNVSPAPIRSSKIHGMGTPVSNIPAGIGTPVNKLPEGVGRAVSDSPRVGSDPKVAGLGSRIQPAVAQDAAEPASTGDAVDEEESQRIAWAFAQSLKGSVGDQVNTGQLQFLVSSNYNALHQGSTFNLSPILEPLLLGAGGNTEGVFLGLIRFRSVLAGMGIEMNMPELGLDKTRQDEILAEARNQNSDAFRAGGVSIDPSSIGPLPGEFTAEKPQTSSKKDDQLAQFNLPGQGDGSPKSKLIKTTVLVLFTAGLGVLSWFVQPSRSLSLSEYSEIFPVTKVATHNGIFVGYLDEYRWQRMTQTEQQVAVVNLQKKLLAQGYLTATSKCQSMCRQVAIMDANDKLVVLDVSGGKLKYVSPE